MAYYYIPGKTPYEDLKIITDNNDKITYNSFKEKFKESLKVINLNYPSELLKRNISSAAILSFHHQKNRLLIGQTMICGKDQNKRSIPVTKILVLKQPYEKKTIWKKLRKGNDEINFPDYELQYRSFKKNISNRSHIHIDKVSDWTKEQEKAFKATFNQIFEHPFLKSGKSMIFNENEISYYDTYFFYSKKKSFKYIIIALTILVILSLIIYFTYLNT